MAQERVGSDIRLLDAYIFGNHEPGGKFLNWRLGQQVVSWGESTFISGGINVINPVDVSKLRVAGAELKEAFEGINMLFGSIDLTEAVAIEALYMFEFEEIIPDPAGTYFSTNDIGTPGGSYAMLGFVYPQPVINPDLYGQVCRQGNYGASDSPLPPSLVAVGCGLSLPRSATIYPSDSGQYGASLRWFLENLGGTELGFYFLNYHSRLPVISGTTVNKVPPGFTNSYWTEVSGGHPAVRRQLQLEHRHLVAGGRGQLPPQSAAAVRRRGGAVRRADAAEPAVPVLLLPVEEPAR